MSAARVSIRPARPDEAAALSDLAYRSKAHWGYSVEFMDACRAELTWSPDDLRRVRPGFRVAEHGALVVGFHALERLVDGRFELAALFVAPECIGRGFGRALIEDAVERTRGCGGRALIIQGDPHAERFYRAAGGERIGERPSGSIPGRSLPVFRIEVG